jgi:hypothetical protein
MDTAAAGVADRGADHLVLLRVGDLEVFEDVGPEGQSVLVGELPAAVPGADEFDQPDVAQPRQVPLRGPVRGVEVGGEAVHAAVNAGAVVFGV